MAIKLYNKAMERKLTSGRAIKILASHTDEFFGHPNFECLWSR